jgi:uncharacterized protein (DUF433 family)
MKWREHITVDAGRLGGQPCLRGTRIPVYVVLDRNVATHTVGAYIAMNDA